MQPSHQIANENKDSNDAKEDQKSDDQKQITIATYNIAGNHNTFKINKIVSVLKSINADVICLQEVSKTGQKHNNNSAITQSEIIANELRMNHIFGQAHQNRIFGNSILSKYPIHNINYLILPRGSLTKDDGSRMPGQYEQRLALAATISPVYDKPQYDFIVISTHLGIYNSKEQSKEGLKNVEIIKQFINKYRQKPALLCGDLNAKINHPIVKTLDLKSPAWNLNVDLNNENTTKTKKIDWILDRGRGIYKMASQNVISFKDSDNASDHCPLIAKWKMIK